MMNTPRTHGLSTLRGVFFFVSICLFLATLVSHIPHEARANVIGNETTNFNPNPSGLDFVTVHGSETLAEGILNSGLFVNRAKNTLPTAVMNDGMLVDPDDWVTFSDFGFAYGVTSRFELGATFSTLLDQQIGSASPGAQFASTGLNDIRLISKYQWLRRDPLGLATVMSVSFNQARNNPFSGRDSGPTVNFELVADGRWRNITVAANAGYRARDKGRPIPGAVYQPLPGQLVASGAMNYYIPSWDTKLIAEVFFSKAIESVPQLKDASQSSEFLLGLKYDWTSRVASHLGAGARMSEGLFAPEWRAYVGLNLALDLLDAPSESPAASPADVPRAEPSEATAKDPIVYTTIKGYTPGDVEKLKTMSFDDITRLHEFKLRTTIPEADIKGEKPPFEVLRLEGFDFEFGSDEIRKENEETLRKLAAYLVAAPNVIKARIEGHTDSIGAEDRKRALSGRRANSVVKFLRKIVNDTVEFESVGFGSDRPIADNGNFQGRRQNRRVEVRILRRLKPLPESNPSAP